MLCIKTIKHLTESERNELDDFVNIAQQSDIIVYEHNDNTLDGCMILVKNKELNITFISQLYVKDNFLGIGKKLLDTAKILSNNQLLYMCCNSVTLCHT